MPTCWNWQTSNPEKVVPQRGRAGSNPVVGTMSRKLDEADVVAIATKIVAHWESIEERATKLALELPNANSGLELKQTIVRSMQEMIGGEEVYEACKQFLEERKRERPN